MKSVEKKLIGLKRVKLSGINFYIKKLTPEDFLDKDGVPISEWQTEYQSLQAKMQEKNVNLNQIKSLQRRVFKRAIIQCDSLKIRELDKDELETFFENLVGNYNLATNLYQEIVNHSLNIKKNFILDVFQRVKQS